MWKAIQANSTTGKGCIVSSGLIVGYGVEVRTYRHVNVDTVIASNARVADEMKINYGNLYQ